MCNVFIYNIGMRLGTYFIVLGFGFSEIHLEHLIMMSFLSKLTLIKWAKCIFMFSPNNLLNKYFLSSVQNFGCNPDHIYNRFSQSLNLKDQNSWHFYCSSFAGAIGEGGTKSVTPDVELLPESLVTEQRYFPKRYPDLSAVRANETGVALPPRANSSLRMVLPEGKFSQRDV